MELTSRSINGSLLDLSPVVVHDPLHEFRRTSVYEIVADGKRVTFAAEECSAGAWGFWQAKVKPE